MYTLQLLSSARQDVLDISQYIAHDLGNPVAAEQLLADMERTIHRIAEFPLSFASYVTEEPVEKTYRRAIVKSYMILFLVDQETETVTVARVVYAKRNMQGVL